MQYCLTVDRLLTALGMLFFMLKHDKILYGHTKGTFFICNKKQTLTGISYTTFYVTQIILSNI